MASEKAWKSPQLLLLSVALLIPIALMAQAPDTSAISMNSRGTAAFASNCSGCHGANAAEMAQARKLVDNPDLRGRSVEKLRDIISAGFPVAGMPPLASLPAQDLDALAIYVRSLNSPAVDTVVPGDVALGRSFFWEKGKCRTCHMVHGAGSPSGQTCRMWVAG